MRIHGEKTFYTQKEFSKKEFNAIESAREQAILNKYGNFSLLGTGSEEMTHVYKVITKSGSGAEESVALKIISGITKECSSSSDLEVSKNQLRVKLRSSEFENRAESEIKLQYDGINRCQNVLPLDGTDLLDWICPDFNRVGVDYVLKMPLADCLFNTIEDFQQAEDHIGKVIQLGIDICVALESLHAKEIYHRDIKPANIYYYHGNYCLGDFGIAIHRINLKLYEMGTQAYCAPEQYYDTRESNPWLCRKYDHRVDIYSLGLVLYELAGKKSVCNLFDQRMSGTLPTLSIKSEGLKKIIQTACQFDPDDRYQNATVFKENLERLQQDKNYVPSQETDTVFQQERNETNYQQPSIDTYIGKEKDPYDDDFDQIEEEKHIGTSVANNMWNVGLFWYKKSQESASRFANLKIDRNIMPLTSVEQELSDNFPVKCHTESDSKGLPLSQIIANINNVGDMYIIGEGGSGKTTALYSIMQDTYKGQMYPSKYADKVTIPLFVELSKAPDVCGKAYQEGHSTFIRRYLYLLIKSAQQKKRMLTEDKNALREAFGNNNNHEQDDIVNTVDHLLSEDNGIQYLLLLDGLNEVSRKEISFKEGSATVVELIINEIQELLEYNNVTVVITSRADEAVNFGNDLPKYYLSGIDDTTIQQYLEENKIPTCNIMQNTRLLNTLRIPFFLKLYCKLIFKSEVSTPGEILYNFFKERTSMYSIRERINIIHSEQNVIGSMHVYKRITEKMQWFILDFIIPEIGWYMEKNSLYTIDLDTIKIITDRILTGSEDTDICGKCGIAFFEDYHKGSDGSINTKTYAKYLLNLSSEHQDYIQIIVDYCVYSLGILYVNNQNYGFIHQHIRDFFAAMKIITDMKLALNNKNKDISIHCLCEFNNTTLHLSVSLFMSDLSTILNSIYKYDFYYKLLNIYRNILDGTVCIGVKNILDIIFRTKNSLSNLNLSYLDLTNCRLYGAEMENSVLTGSKQTINTVFLKGYNGNISGAVFSPNGKHIFMLVGGTAFKVWNTQSIYEEYALSNRNFLSPIEDMQYIYGEYSVSGKLIFTVSIVCENDNKSFIINVYDTTTMKCLKTKKTKVCDTIKISPDDKYLIIGNQNRILNFYPIFQNKLVFTRKVNLKKIFKKSYFTQLDFSNPYMLIPRTAIDPLPRIAIDPLGRYIAVAMAYDPDIVFLDAHSLKEEFRITLHDLPQQLNYFTQIRKLEFSSDGKYMALSTSSIKKIFILDIEQRLILNSISKSTWGMLNFNFIKYKSEICLLLTSSNGEGYDYINYYPEVSIPKLNISVTNVIVWSFIQDKKLVTLKYNDCIIVYDCFEDMVLFKNSNGFQISHKLDFSDSTLLNQYQDISENILGQFFSADKKYLIIYSKKYIQIWIPTTMSDMYEIKFHESIHKVLYASDKLYILCENNTFRVYDLITRKVIVQNNELFNYAKTHLLNFYISPKGNYLFIQVEIDKYEVYDAKTLKYLQPFKGDFISFNSTETSFIVGYNYMRERRINTHRVRLQEWKRNEKSTCIFECTSNLSEEIILRATEQLETPINDIDSIDGIPHFNITNAMYIPNTNKLLISLYCMGAGYNISLLLNLDTSEVEKIIESTFENYSYNNGFNKYILNSRSADFSNNCIPIINLYDLEQFELDHIDSTYNINDIKEVDYNLLFHLSDNDIVVIINVKTRKYMVIPFLPKLYVKNSVFKNIQLPKYKDIEAIFNVLEMYGAKIN